MQLWSSGTNGAPGSKIADLSPPSSDAGEAGNRLIHFEASPGLELAGNTTYYLAVFTTGTLIGDDGRVVNPWLTVVQGEDEPADGYGGWSIAYEHYTGNNQAVAPGAATVWSQALDPLIISINGPAPLAVEARPPCGATVADASVKPSANLVLTPAPAAETATEHRWLSSGMQGAWTESLPVWPTGRSVWRELSPLTRVTGYEFRLKDTTTITAKCTWQVGAGGTPPGGGGGGGGGGGAGGGDDGDAPSTCTLAAPYWSGPSGGFTVMPAVGRSSVSVTCGGSTTEYSAENGVVTRLVSGSCPGGLRVEGAAPGGWYWQHGERNAAAAPFVCSEALGGPKAVVPGGVTAEATDDATWFRHDEARLVGIVPHLERNECSEYVSPYWQGDGGVVVRPAEGRSTAKVRVQCGATWSTLTASPGDDGVAAELVRKDYCTDDEGEPRQGKLTVTGAAPGGWYWISGERNAAVAPLMCADLLGGPSAVDPGGVFSRATEDGTYFSHETDRLIGVVPHVGSARDE